MAGRCGPREWAGVRPLGGGVNLPQSLSVRPRNVVVMDSTSPLSAAEANAAIRRFVAGRVTWGPADLAELDRLRRSWAEAVRRETVLAA